jgi:hypothetical protein
MSVYFLKPVDLPGPIKIGWGQYPTDRLGWYAKYSPIPLELILVVPGGYELEKALHEHFADVHSHREWFHAAPRLVSAIAAMKAGTPPHEAVDLHDRRGNVRALKLADARARKGTSQETTAH